MILACVDILFRTIYVYHRLGLDKWKNFSGNRRVISLNFARLARYEWIIYLIVPSRS